jgi:hypothetical protein
MDLTKTSTTQSVAALRSRAERGNEQVYSSSPL